MDDVLSYFGEILIRQVRDRTIREFDKIVTGNMNDESSQKLFKQIQQMSNDHQEIINKIIPEIVDLCIDNLLCMLDDYADDIKVQIENENISEISDGLAGELYTEDGWIQKYSNQRYEEDF